MNDGTRLEQSVGLLQALGLERRRIVDANAAASDAWLPWHWWRRRSVEGRWALIKTLVMAAAVVVGFWGFQVACLSEDKCDPASRHIIYRNAFRTLQLLTTQFPPEMPPTLPWQLHLARFLLPLFTFLFTLDTVLARLGRPLGLMRLLRLRHHVVVVGAGEEAERIARQLKAGDHRLAIVATPRDEPEATRLARLGVVVGGDPKLPDTLADARVYRARALFVLTGDDSAGVATVAAANFVCRQQRDLGGPPLQVVLALAQPELRRLVSGQIVSAARDNGVDLRLYVRETNIARSLLIRFPPDWGLPTGAHDLHLAIVGVGAMGSELLMQAIRVATPEPGQRLVVTLIDRDAAAIVESLRADCPTIEQCCELRVLPIDVRTGRIQAGDVAQWFGTAPAATSIYICCGDDDANLAMAVGIRKAYGLCDRLSPPLFVYQRRGPALVNALAHLGGTNFDAFRMVPFGSLDEGLEPYYLLNEEVDRLAETLHASYVANLAPRRKDTPAQRPWAELAETFRAATRARADHLLYKMRRLGWHASLLPTETTPSASPDRLEKLAELEHERWSRERRLDGWTYAPARDDAQKEHPSLVPYDQLDEAMKQLDRTVASDIVQSLKSIGLSVRTDYRLGIWFHAEADESARGPAIAAERALDRLRAAYASRHLQVILPLRSPLELSLGEAIHADPELPVRIEVGLIASGATFQTELTSPRDRDRAQRLVYGADRAFVLSAATGEADSQSRALAALAAACDEVLVIATTYEMAQSLIEVCGVADRKLTSVGALERAD